jgi:hypothetical protein
LHANYPLPTANSISYKLVSRFKAIVLEENDKNGRFD